MSKVENHNEVRLISLNGSLFGGHNCADGCILLNPHVDRDRNGKTVHCSHHSTSYYPRESRLLSYKD